MTEVPKTSVDYTNEEVVAIVQAYHEIKHKAGSSWNAIHPEFGLLETEKSMDALKLKLKTLYRKRVRKACVIMTSGEIMRVFNEMCNRPKPKPVEKVMNEVVTLQSGSAPTWNLSPHQQPPFTPTLRSRSPREMIIDGAGRFRSYGGK